MTVRVVLELTASEVDTFIKEEKSLKYLVFHSEDSNIKYLSTVFEDSLNKECKEFKAKYKDKIAEEIKVI